MPKNHDYSAPDIEGLLVKLGAKRKEVVDAIEKLNPIAIPIPDGKDRVEIARHAKLKPVADLLGAKNSPFTAGYALEVGVHWMFVRSEKKEQLFRLLLLAHPERGNADDAKRADEQWLKLLDNIEANGKLEQIASAAFLQNHVTTKQAPKGQPAGGAELDSALRSILREKATTVILLDDVALRDLAGEVMYLTRRNEYSSSGSYDSRRAYETYNLDPQTEKFQILAARFKYSVYHEPADGLWRISHYEGIVGPKLLREVKLGALGKASNYTQTDAQKEDTRRWREARDDAAKKLAAIESRRDAALASRKEAEASIGKLDSRISEVQAQVDDWAGYAKKFSAEHEILSEGEIAKRVEILEAKTKQAEQRREDRKPAVTFAEQELRRIDAMAAPTGEPAIEERRKLREKAAKLLEQAIAERTDAAEAAKVLAKERDTWKRNLKEYKKYVAENTPTPKDKLEATLRQQRDALARAHVQHDTASKDLAVAQADEHREAAQRVDRQAARAEQHQGPGGARCGEVGVRQAGFGEAASRLGGPRDAQEGQRRIQVTQHDEGMR
jgi:hypothetical protein